MNFPSIRLEGSILTADLLDAIAREDKHSQKPTDFGLATSTKVKDEIASTWASAKALWTGYQAKIANLHEGQSGASETRNLFMIPLLALLGYQPERTEAELVNGKSYAISHRDISRDGFPLHIMGWHDSLEKKRDSGGPRVSAHALVQDYLNLTEHSYGIITNGRHLRLLRDSSRLIKLSFLEFDLNRIFEEDLYADFAILFRLLHATRMPTNRANASASVIEKYHQESVDSGSRIRDGLAAAVAFSMQTVADGLLAHPANTSLAEQLRHEPARAEELHQNLLRWVYRTLFVLVIEERVLHHAPTATLRQRQLYRDYYSLQRLRRLADRPQLADRRAHDLWRAMHQTLRLYEDGGKGLPLGIAPLGSFLFREEGLQNLFQYQLDNRSFLQALNRLSTFTHPDTQVRMRVNHGALDVEEFGSVYESLLELRPRITPEGEKLTFSYVQLAGNERKTTGSYYTPDSLVQCLLDSALDPVVEGRLKGKTGPAAEEALLSIKVCDPAVGSGHFLIGAAHRLAQRLADIRAGEEALSPDVQRHSLRDVVSRCLYGVDINPLSVELCKVSLWMLSMEPGKSLGFLDHHIQSGNSLLGATPHVLADGLPDDAFKPIEGDDKSVCAEAKKRNKSERQQLALFHGIETAPWERLGNLPAAMLAVGTMSDDTTEALHAKEKRYAELVRGASYKSAGFLADAWCAAFVWKKCKLADRGFDYPITNDVLRKIERNPHDCAPWMREEIERLRDRYQFFHWHLAFPEVFPAPEKGECPANQHAGWNGGFDVMLGNPPWERVKMQQKEWFAERRPDIAEAPSASVRKRLIEQLAQDDPALYVAFNEAVRQAEGESHVLRDSGLFPLCARGDVNLYAVFAESIRQHLAPTGRMGAVLPSGIVTDDTTKFFFQAVTKSRSLVSLFDFENKGIFPVVDSRYKFCLFTAGGGLRPIAESADFVFFAHSTEELRDSARRFQLSAEAIRAINPDTETCPVFRSARDAEINAVVYRRVSVFGHAEQRTPGFWAARIPQGLYHQTNDAALLREQTQLAAEGFVENEGGAWERESERYHRMFEGRMVHLFNHRAASVGISKTNTFRSGVTIDVGAEQLRDPRFIATPRYCVPQAETESRIPDDYLHPWMLVFKDVTGATNERTMIASFIPRTAVVYSLRVVLLRDANAADAASLAANLNTFSFDYFARCKTPGNHITDYIFRQLPVLPPATYAEPCAWAGQPAVTYRDWLLPRVLELTYTAWDLEPFARDSEWFGPPFVWDEARRFKLRCELDAAFLHLYGLSRADAAYILDTFPSVRRKDEARTEETNAAGEVIKSGRYITKDTILEIYDALAESQRTGRPYQTRLNPPPGPPVGSDGFFVSYESVAGNPPPHLHLPRGASRSLTAERQLADLGSEFPSIPFILRLGTRPDSTRVRITPSCSTSLKSGDSVVFAHPRLSRGLTQITAAIGRIAIQTLADANTGKQFVSVQIRNDQGTAGVRVTEEEWAGLITVGRVESQS